MWHGTETDLDGGDGALELADVAGDEDDVGALGGELLGNAEAHALRGTSDQDGLEMSISDEVLAGQLAGCLSRSMRTSVIWG